MVLHTYRSAPLSVHGLVEFPFNENALFYQKVKAKFIQISISLSIKPCSVILTMNTFVQIANVPEQPTNFTNACNCD